MQKKFLTFILFVICSVSLVACSNDKATRDKNISDTKIEEFNDSVGIEDSSSEAPEIGIVKIELSDEQILVNGKAASIDSTDAVYIANDIIYYESGRDFTYGKGKENDAHSEEEANLHTVVHITHPGEYELSGDISAGQIAVDLGKEERSNPEAVVTLYLNGVNITNTVAPGIIFYNVYEPFEDVTIETATSTVDTTAAGANIIIVDDTENTINGSYVARIYKPESVVLNDEKTEVIKEKKLHKYDAALHSRMTMNIGGGEKGNGVLNINGENEGLDTEMHLTINGGIINIESIDDGINTNEDLISVTTINGGEVNIVVGRDGKSKEGDGIDSNGWLVINGGTIVSQACSFSGDIGIDGDKGVYINGGNVIATGNMSEHLMETDYNFATFTFKKRINSGSLVLKDFNGEIVIEHDVENDFVGFLVANEKLVSGDYTIWHDDIQLGGIRGKFGENIENPTVIDVFEIKNGSNSFINVK